MGQGRGGGLSLTSTLIVPVPLASEHLASEVLCGSPSDGLGASSPSRASGCGCGCGWGSSSPSSASRLGGRSSEGFDLAAGEADAGVAWKEVDVGLFAWLAWVGVEVGQTEARV